MINQEAYVSKKVTKNFPVFFQGLTKYLQDRNIKLVSDLKSLSPELELIPCFYLPEELNKSDPQSDRNFNIVFEDTNTKLIATGHENYSYVVSSSEELQECLKSLDVLFLYLQKKIKNECIKLSNKQKFIDEDRWSKDDVIAICSVSSLDELNRVLERLKKNITVTSISSLYYRPQAEFIFLKECGQEAFVLCSDDQMALQDTYWISEVLDNFVAPQVSAPSSTKEVPFLLVSSDNNILKTNVMFSRLGVDIKDISAQENKERMLIGSDYYKVSSFHLGQGQKLYLFLRLFSSKEILGQSGDEIGIISSSLAHELKNPLAGILASLELLLIDDWDNESLEILNEMKSSALRCKKLIQTFLSFSKKEMSLYGSDEQLTVEECCSQAFDLLRSRLADNNIRLIKEYKVKFSIQTRQDLSTLPMIFYLIFSEIVTALSHEELVSSKQIEVLNISVIEDKNLIEIECPGLDLGAFSEEINSSLLEYLTQAQSIKLSLSSKKVLLELL